MKPALRIAAVDTAVVLALLAVAGLGVAPLFGSATWVAPVTVGLIVGTALAWIGSRAAWGVLPLAGALVAVLALVGPALAAPDQALAGLLPTPAALATLLRGVVFGWRDIVTTSSPVGGDDQLRAIPLLLAGLASLLAVSAVLRLARPAVALVPVAAVLVVVGLIGTGTDVAPGAQVAVLLVVGLTWLAWHHRMRQAHAHTVASVRPGPLAAIGGVALLAFAGGTALAATEAVHPGPDRTALRQIVKPPFDARDYATPLGALRKYVKAKEQPQLKVSGFPAGGRLRLATLDSFDGVVWTVSPPGAGPITGSFERAGARTGEAGGPPGTMQVEVLGYRGPWLPTVGQTAGVQFSSARDSELSSALFYNSATGTAVDTAGLREGDSYRLDYVRTADPAPSSLVDSVAAPVLLPEPRRVPELVAATAATFAGDAKPGYGQALAVQNTLRKGFFSDGTDPNGAPSRAGHGSDRMVSLLENTSRMIGDDEQYASAMALMARQLQLPSRVVVGFVPKGSGTVTVTASDIAAWVEIDLAGSGWVSFFPTPNEDRVPPKESPQSKARPRPQVQQPPPPVEQAEPPTPIFLNGKDAKDAEEKAEKDKPARRGLGLAVKVAVPLLVVLAPFLLLLLVKAVRRRRRRGRGTTIQRIAGGWQEVLDRARDLGTRPPARSTRREVAGVLEQVHGGSAVALAERADAHVFAPGVPVEEQVRQFWAEVDDALRAMTSGAGPLRRFRARVSPASLRRRG